MFWLRLIPKINFLLYTKRAISIDTSTCSTTVCRVKLTLHLSPNSLLILVRSNLVDILPFHHEAADKASKGRVGILFCNSGEAIDAVYQ